MEKAGVREQDIVAYVMSKHPAQYKAIQTEFIAELNRIGKNDAAWEILDEALERSDWGEKATTQPAK
jgi:hypothetical protein